MNERIIAFAWAAFILMYWILDLNNLWKPLTQALIHPMFLVLWLCQCHSICHLLDVDTAGTLQTTARLVAFAATLSIATIPASIYLRTKKKLALVAAWCGLALVALGILHFVLSRVTYAF